MTSHVSGQDYSQEAHSEGREFFTFKILQKVESVLPQDCERFSSMHVLIDGLITVADCELRH